MPTPEEISAEIRQNFGFMAWAIDHPELGPLLVQAANEDWAPEVLRGRIYATTWWKQTEPATREWERTLNEDPAKATAMRAQKRTEMKVLLSRLGVQVNEERVNALAEYSLRFGWDDNLTLSVLANELNFDEKGNVAGDQTGSAYTVGASIDQLQAEYMVDISPETKIDLTRDMVAGRLTEDGLRSFFLTQAQSRWSAISEQLAAGVTPKAFFDPYIGQAAELLEVPRDSIDLRRDPRFQALTEFVDDKGRRRPMTLQEAAVHVRKLDAYKQTRGAQAQGAAVTEAVLRNFGAVA